MDSDKLAQGSFFYTSTRANMAKGNLVVHLHDDSLTGRIYRKLEIRWIPAFAGMTKIN
mgnify:CR=1 FL=1